MEKFKNGGEGERCLLRRVVCIIIMKKQMLQDAHCYFVLNVL